MPPVWCGRAGVEQTSQSYIFYLVLKWVCIHCTVDEESLIIRQNQNQSSQRKGRVSNTKCAPSLWNQSILWKETRETRESRCKRTVVPGSTVKCNGKKMDGQTDRKTGKGTFSAKQDGPFLTKIQMWQTTAALGKEHTIKSYLKTKVKTSKHFRTPTEWMMGLEILTICIFYEIGMSWIFFWFAPNQFLSWAQWKQRCFISTMKSPPCPDS